MRLVHAVGYLGFLFAEVVRGSWQVTRNALSPRLTSTPSIVEYRSRCCTDFEIAAMTSSITITPGTLVLGIATESEGSPPVIYVHSLFGGTRERVVAGLVDMEERMLRAMRRPAKGGRR